MDKKYYWVCYYNTSYNQLRDGLNTAVTETHPFIEYKYSGTRTILNWREITEEDYNLFKKMENEL